MIDRLVHHADVIALKDSNRDAWENHEFCVRRRNAVVHDAFI
jgi:hypothetical protein